jgi:predicted RNA binding protein YcfA (HicA-like mRNA interferase family)
MVKGRHSAMEDDDDGRVVVKARSNREFKVGTVELSIFNFLTILD